MRDAFAVLIPWRGSSQACFNDVEPSREGCPLIHLAVDGAVGGKHSLSLLQSKQRHNLSRAVCVAGVTPVKEQKVLIGDQVAICMGLTKAEQSEFYLLFLFLETS